MGLPAWLAWAEAPPPPWLPPSHALLPLCHVPLLLHAALFHPAWAARPGVRLARVALLPVSLGLATSVMGRFGFAPLSRRGPFNLGLGCWGVHLVLKSLEWAFCPPAPLPALRPLFRAPGPVRSVDRASPAPAEAAEWALDQLFSSRGLKYVWGSDLPPGPGPGLVSIATQLVRSNVLQVLGLWISVLARDYGSLRAAAVRAGVPSVPGLGLLSDAVATLGFGLLVIGAAEHGFCCAMLLAYLIGRVARPGRLPRWAMAFVDMRLYPPLFDAPWAASSLAQLWGRGWHQLYRRSFLVCGAMPARWLAKRVGLRSKAQRVCGLFGAFLVSGLMHEVAIQCVARPTHAHPHTHLESFPGALVYFLLQPIGILLEPYIIPLIPAPLGGGWLWTLLFTLATARPFREQYVANGRLIDDIYPHSSQWTWINFLVPATMLQW